MDILTFWGLDYRVPSHITSYLVVIGIIISKIQYLIVKKNENQHVLNGRIDL